ncbi:hypothetical protein B0H99_10118 [Planomicrobium soli]|uniref:Immunity protein 50 of polymorphic toxin system n=1 Tax=Planomicrobium soli TaxID=1176648 RepID=A0A2P8H6A6_9BACL|nr:hypothetical protein [Planomicrobium soli]PSL41775.1 hypothetical protein B0H99_10118 [Planomicrobium soli]
MKNSELLSKYLKDFSYANIKCLTNFNLSFLKDFDIYSSLLDIDFLVESEDGPFLVQLRFRDPQNIRFESLGYFQPVDLVIVDLSRKGWENIKYEVEDFENNTLGFYCSEIEVISVTKTNLRIQ